MADFLDNLNEALRKFNAEQVNDITDKYSYFPDYANARLGAGSYGEAFRMKSVSNANEPPRVVKIIPKSRVTKTALQIQHLAAELAVTGFFSHSNLNKRVGLYHNSSAIYLVLELVGGTTPDAKTRLIHLFTTFHPRRLADFDSLWASLERDAKAGGFASVDAYLDGSGRMRTILAECGAKREIPTATDLFGLIVAMKRVPEGLARIINRQALQGLQHLHENCVVHRDIKTENLVLGIERQAEILYGPDGKIRGARVLERVQSKLIDFGLVKYMRIGSFPSVLSPGMFDPSRPNAGGLAAVATNAQAADLAFSDDDDDDKPAAAAAAATKPPQPAAQHNNFPVMVTPCGTELYCSLEVIDGIIRSGVGRNKWISDSANLPKMDIYGVGTMLFCCANGRPPFRPPRDPYRANPSREERIKQVQRLILAGPVFAGDVNPLWRQFIEYLMTNDANARPTAAQALNHAFMQAFPGNTYAYEVTLDGTVTQIDARQLQQQPQQQPGAASPAAPPPSAVADVTGSSSSPASSTAAPNAPAPTAASAAADTTDDAAAGSGSAAGGDSIATGAAADGSAGGEEGDDAEHHDEEEILAAALRGREDDGDTSGKAV